MQLDKSETLIKFGKRFKYLRVTNGYTQADLALELEIEISQISRIERGLINTSVFMIYQVSKTLNISPAEFFK